MITQKVRFVPSSTASADILDKNVFDVDDLEFYVFEYIIPRPIVPPVKRLSKIYCAQSFSDVARKGKKYSLWNANSCWWGLPFGPMAMLDANKKNKTGINVTDDVKDFVTHQAIIDGLLKMPIIEGEFEHLDKPLIKEFSKTLSNHCPLSDFSPLIGYIKHKRKHYFYVGISNLSSEMATAIKSDLSNSFSRSTIFEIVDLQETSRVQARLEREGTQINKL